MRVYLNSNFVHRPISGNDVNSSNEVINEHFTDFVRQMKVAVFFELSKPNLEPSSSPCQSAFDGLLSVQY